MPIDNIAWAGELLMLEAKWTDRDGHTVKFQLVTPNEERPNPFKQFTKRRSGKAGTRFHMTASEIVKKGDPQIIAYDGEAMLAGWSDTNSTGYVVSFWVHPTTGVHPFELHARNVSAFMCVLVELTDQDEAVNQAKRAKIEAIINPQQVGLATVKPEGSEPPPAAADPPPGPKPAGQRLSMVAALLCSNPLYQKFIGCSMDATAKEQAAHYMRAKLGIESRSELDNETNFELRRRFHQEIRIPFAESQERQNVR